jgi:hypothetical protein
MTQWITVLRSTDTNVLACRPRCALGTPPGGAPQEPMQTCSDIWLIEPSPGTRSLWEGFSRPADDAPPGFFRANLLL